MNNIIIVLEGGLVKEVYSTLPDVEYRILDVDKDSIDLIWPSIWHKQDGHIEIDPEKFSDDLIDKIEEENK